MLIVRVMRLEVKKRAICQTGLKISQLSNFFISELKQSNIDNLLKKAIEAINSLK